jgi:hypothetical protein
MKHLIKNPRDFWAGAMFLAVGVLFASIAFTYKLGTAARMGPGYFPFYLGLLLAVLGIAICLSAMKLKNAGPAVEKFHWLPLGTVLFSIVLFGVLLKLTGVLAAGVGLVIGSSLGSGEFKWKEVLLLAIGLTVFCAAVFVGGLKLPIPMCPGFEFFEQYALCRI